MAAITIGTNTASMMVQRGLAQSTFALTRVSQRLSSGLRISHAADDAAGLSIASALNADARVYAQGIRNISDGVSLLSIAEGAVRELDNITTRINELAIQSANGTLSDRQRKPLNAEAQQLIAEYNRIVDVTEFNQQAILTGSANPIGIQGGYGQSGRLSIAVGGSLATIVTPDGTLGAEQTYAGIDGIGPRLGDFNNDGFDDILNSNVDSPSIQVLLSNGNGTFKLSATYSVSSGAAEGTIADFNSDGNLDFAVPGGEFDTTFSVYLGNGNGTFRAPNIYDTGAVGLTYSDAADYNGDGRLDLVIGTDANNSVRVYFGNADGTFGGSRSIILPEPTVDVRAFSGDFNGDGKADIVSFDSFDPQPVGIYVSLGNGDGTFKALTSYTAGSRFGRGEAADINGDGYEDFVVGDFVGNQIYLYLSNANGSFKAPSQIAAVLCSDVDLADMNADGIKDIISTNAAGGTIDIYLGNGNGSFKAAVSQASANGPDTFGLGDINGDGATDLVTTFFGGGYGLGVMLANTTLGSHVWNIDLSNRSQALDSLASIRNVQNAVHGELANIGSFDSRLDAAGRILSTSRENMLSAFSQIVDADVAAEASSLVQQKMLQQAAAAVLAQANQLPALALQLLSAAG